MVPSFFCMRLCEVLKQDSQNICRSQHHGIECFCILLWTFPESMSVTASWHRVFFVYVCGLFHSKVVCHLSYTASWYRVFWVICVGIYIVRRESMWHWPGDGTKLFLSTFMENSLSGNIICVSHRIMVPSFFGNLCGNLHSKKRKHVTLTGWWYQAFFVNFYGKFIVR